MQSELKAVRRRATVASLAHGTPRCLSACATFQCRNATFKIWRREWDSNPRYGYPHTDLANQRLQPLGHLSAGSGARHAVCKTQSSPFHPLRQRPTFSRWLAAGTRTGPRMSATRKGAFRLRFRRPPRRPARSTRWTASGSASRPSRPTPIGLLRAHRQARTVSPERRRPLDRRSNSPTTRGKEPGPMNAFTVRCALPPGTPPSSCASGSAPASFVTTDEVWAAAECRSAAANFSKQAGRFNSSQTAYAIGASNQATHASFPGCEACFALALLQAPRCV